MPWDAGVGSETDALVASQLLTRSWVSAVLAVFGQANDTGIADHQTDAKIFFEVLDCSGHGGRRNVEFPCRTSKAATIGHCHEDTDEMQPIHPNTFMLIVSEMIVRY